MTGPKHDITIPDLIHLYVEIDENISQVNEEVIKIRYLDSEILEENMSGICVPAVQLLRKAAGIIILNIVGTKSSDLETAYYYCQSARYQAYWFARTSILEALLNISKSYNNYRYLASAYINKEYERLGYSGRSFDKESEYIHQVSDDSQGLSQDLEIGAGDDVYANSTRVVRDQYYQLKDILSVWGTCDKSIQDDICAQKEKTWWGRLGALCGLFR